MKRILIIEDDPAILIGLTDNFGDRYEVLSFRNGERGFEDARSGAADLIILDLMLPGMGGREICRDLRRSGITTPILILTSRSEESERVKGFELGADDYVTKPFSLGEVNARVKALLRRGSGGAGSQADYTFGDIRINFLRCEAWRGGEALHLTAKEFRILRYFIGHEGEVVTRGMLLDDVWGYERFPTTRTVDNYILSLRKKIEREPSEPKHIVTLHSAGYRFLR